MPTVNLSPVFNFAQLDSSGNPNSGGKLFTYAAGSSTKTNTYTTSAGTVAHTNPIVLNARGEPPSPIWLTDGQTYKFVYTNSGDTDPPASPIRTIDNITGINDDAATAASEWTASGLTPTYVSSTSFTVSGDHTSVAHVGRQLKITDGAGTDYAAISKSAYDSGPGTTTITIDAAVLTTPVSAVSYGIVAAANTSMPLPDTAILAPYSPLTAFENLACAQATVATATITADKVVVTNTNGRKSVLSTVSLTVNLGSAGANGLDTGAEASSTWYYLWVIWNGVTTAGLISASSTAPTLPSGYTHKGLVGAMYNSSGSDIVAFYQANNAVVRAAVALVTGGVATSLTSLTITAAVPPNARAIALFGNIQEAGVTVNINAVIAPSNAGTFEQTLFFARGVNADAKGTGGTARMRLIPGTPALWYKVNAADTDLDLSATGWEF